MQQWYVHDNGATNGPFTAEQVKESIKTNKIGAAATFCVTGTTTFRPITEFPELVPAQPTELPVVAAKRCGVCACPIARALIKVLILAAVVAGGAVAAKKLGLGCCKKNAVVRPL
jgi:hypothetical protein